MSCPNLTNPSLDNATSRAAVDHQSPEELTASLIHHYFMDIGIPVVCSFGIVGNILNLIVLTTEKTQRQLTKMELSAHMGLIALAFSDFMFCLLALLFVLLPLRGVYDDGSLVIYYDWFGGGFITMFIVTSTWLIVVMAGERYLAVCHPFKARNWISLRRTRISIIAIFVVCALCTVPIFLQSRLHGFQCGGGDNATYLTIVERSMFTRRVIAVRRLVWSVLFDFIPCASLIYFNICLIWKIHHAKKMRRNMAPMHCHEQSGVGQKNGAAAKTVSFKRSPGRLSYKTSCSVELESHSQGSSPHAAFRTVRHISRKRSQDSALNSVTATLVAVVIMFLIFVSPSELLKFVMNYMTDTKQHNVKVVNAITNFMQALNFSTNFVLYCVINKSFRQTLKSIITLNCYISSRKDYPILERSG